MVTGWWNGHTMLKPCKLAFGWLISDIPVQFQGSCCPESNLIYRNKYSYQVPVE